MSRFGIWFKALALGLVLTGPAWAKLGAELDRAPIAAGESFNLILSLDKEPADEPDLTVLHSLFTVQGISQVQQQQIVNGRASTLAQRQITLKAKQAGIYHIPAIAWSGESSEALEVRVVPASEVTLPDVTETLFMKAELDSPEVPVYAQALLTVRVYYASQIYNKAQFGPLVVDKALVEPLGKERQYQRQLNGRNYGVIEKRYALFPQQAGELAIPAIGFDTEVASRRGRSFPLDVFNRTEEEHLESAPLTLKVLPAPAGAPQPWLPARQLALKSELSPAGEGYRAGEPLTWTVTAEADGQAAALLPPLQPTELAGAKLYPDAPALSQRIADDRLIGVRSEKLAVLPTSAGKLRLPEIRLRWWDLKEHKAALAVLPARELDILPGAVSTASAPASATAEPAAAGSAPPAQARAVQATPGFWPWLSAALAAAWLATLALWWRQRRPGPRPSTARVEADRAAAWKALEQALRRAPAGAVLQALRRWARLRFPGLEIKTGEALCARLSSPELAEELGRLHAEAYAPAAPDRACDRERLLQALQRAEGSTSIRTQSPSLPELYPVRGLAALLPDKNARLASGGPRH